MNKVVLFICLLLALFNTTVAQEVISTQGSTYTNSTATIDFTIGEAIISTQSNGIHDICQGFHQTNWNFVDLEDFDRDFEVSVLPNPLENVLVINAPIYLGKTYVLYDAQGRIVVDGKLDTNKTLVSVEFLSPALYTLVVKERDTLLKSFKLIKNQ